MHFESFLNTHLNLVFYLTPVGHVIQEYHVHEIIGSSGWVPIFPVFQFWSSLAYEGTLKDFQLGWSCRMQMYLLLSPASQQTNLHVICSLEENSWICKTWLKYNQVISMLLQNDLWWTCRHWWVSSNWEITWLTCYNWEEADLHYKEMLSLKIHLQQKYDI